MIVVADTSVIINLCRIGQARLLLSLFKRVVVPQAVADEFIRLTRTRDRFENEAGFWIAPDLRSQVLFLVGE